MLARVLRSGLQPVLPGLEDYLVYREIGQERDADCREFYNRPVMRKLSAADVFILTREMYGDW